MHELKSTSYKIINSIFIFILFGVLFYSFIYPYLKFPIKSSCEGLPINICKSRGLSRAFSDIIRFNFIKAKQHNIYSINIFLFFTYQLASRIIINFLLPKLNNNLILFLDLTASITLFILVFLPLVI